MTTEDIERANEDYKSQHPDLSLDSGTSAREMLEQTAQKLGKPYDSSDVQDHMPTDFYLQHPEMKDLYGVRGDIAADLIPDVNGVMIKHVQEGPTANLKNPQNRDDLILARDGTPFVRTPFGPLRILTEAQRRDPKNKTYKAVLTRINALLKIGDNASARKLYESLHRTDRGIELSPRRRMENSQKALDELKNKIVSSQNETEQDTHLANAQSLYSSLPAHIRIEESVRNRLRDLEATHASIRADDRSSQGWVRGGLSRLGNFTRLTSRPKYLLHR
ncbi:MAG: hypothetical protein LBK92_02850 [Endomicrobium sp.]|jgi:hypothetical protein|nr:hypothetical protein [Endomicrobium sp.]